jgi:hypothetical protein
MIDLQSTTDYVWLFLIAAGFGAIGGIAYELLQAGSGRESGSLEMPGRRGHRFFDLGFIASVLVGAVAAVAITYFFTPEVQTAVNEGGKQVIVTKWQIVKVVPLSLIVGSAGGAFLTAMQTRLKEQLAAATKAAGDTALDQMATAAKVSAKRAATSVGEKLMPTVQGTVQEASAAIPDRLFKGLKPLMAKGVIQPEIAAFVRSAPAESPQKRLEDIQEAVSTATQEATDEASAAIDAHLEQARKSIGSLTA